jgi:hypothetical protein
MRELPPCAPADLIRQVLRSAVAERASAAQSLMEQVRGLTVTVSTLLAALASAAPPSDAALQVARSVTPLPTLPTPQGVSGGLECSGAGVCVWGEEGEDGGTASWPPWELPQSCI